MARPGVLYEDIAHAATQLLQADKALTVDNIRATLGNTGSKSTIAPLLKQWKLENAGLLQQERSQLPDPILLAVQSLHGLIQADCKKELLALQAIHEQSVRNADEREEKVNADLSILQKRLTLIQEQLAQTQNAMQVMQEEKQALETSLQEADSKQTFSAQRLADKEQQIQFLESQLKSAHQQFNHYQEQSVQQRKEEKRQSDMQIRQILAERDHFSGRLQEVQAINQKQEAQLHHLISEARKQASTIESHEEQIETLLSTRSQLSTQLEIALDKNQVQQNDYSQIKTIVEELRQENISLNSSLQKLQFESEIQRRNIHSLETEKAMFMQVLTQLGQAAQKSSKQLTEPDKNIATTDPDTSSTLNDEQNRQA